MNQVTVTTKLTITDGDKVEVFELTEACDTGGNPRYKASDAAATMAYVAKELEASVVARHGDIRAIQRAG